VPCEWSVKKPVEASKCKDWTFFTMEPFEGVLEPNEKLNVKVIFTPVLGRETPYLQVSQ
jgi:hydrocephalus-inducing protein